MSSDLESLVFFPLWLSVTSWGGSSDLPTSLHKSYEDFRWEEPHGKVRGQSQMRSCSNIQHNPFYLYILTAELSVLTVERSVSLHSNCRTPLFLNFQTPHEFECSRCEVLCIFMFPCEHVLDFQRKRYILWWSYRTSMVTTGGWFQRRWAAVCTP